MSQVMDLLAKDHDLVAAITAIAALLVSAYSILLSIRNMEAQRTHNRISVKPIGHISLGDYEDRLTVRLRNNGIGPMLIDNVTVTQQGASQETKPALIDFMPDLPEGIFWTTFVGDVASSVISADKDMSLLTLEGNSGNAKFARARESVRLALSELQITVTYRDIYEQQMPPVGRSLQWFARNIDIDGAVRRKT